MPNLSPRLSFLTVHILKSKLFRKLSLLFVQFFTYFEIPQVILNFKIGTKPTFSILKTKNDSLVFLSDTLVKSFLYHRKQHSQIKQLKLRKIKLLLVWYRLVRIDFRVIKLHLLLVVLLSLNFEYLTRLFCRVPSVSWNCPYCNSTFV